MQNKSAEALATELRESYMQLKELSSRCMIDMENIAKNDYRVFYFKPNSDFLSKPEKQKVYRQDFIESVSAFRPADATQDLADQLDAEVQEIVHDGSLSDPEAMRKFLVDFYQRRLYFLQQKKYKMLTRWAHFALTSETIDRIGSQATFDYGRIEYEIENSLKRFERLQQKDGYEDVRDGKVKRPQTLETKQTPFKNAIEAAEFGQDSLQDRTKDPVSCIRMDDFEVLLRVQTYQDIVMRPMQKFLTKARWIPTTKGSDIFKEFHIRYKELLQAPYREQLILAEAINTRFKDSLMKKTEDRVLQMQEILLEDLPAQRVALAAKQKQQATENKGQSAQRENPSFDYIDDRCPMHIQNLVHLQHQIQEAASRYGITGNVEIDDGFSFTYQVQVFFTVYYQKQVIESCFGRYNGMARDPHHSSNTSSNVDRIGKRDGLSQKIDQLYQQFDCDIAHDFSEVQKRNLRSLLLVDFALVDLQNTNQDGTSLPLIKKGKKISEQIPDLQKTFGDVKIIRLKKAAWVEEQVLMRPRVPDWLVKQRAALAAEVAHGDELLKAQLDLVDISDPSAVNVLYESFARVYEQVARIEHSVNYLTEHVKMETERHSDAVAKQFLSSFSNCLAGHLAQNKHKAKLTSQEVDRLRKERYSKQGRTPIDTTGSDLRRLPVHLVQCYYTLKHMQLRDSKTRLLKIFNFFRSIQKRIVLELKEFSRREVVNNHAQMSPPEEAYYVGDKAGNLTENYQNMGIQKQNGGDAPGSYKTKIQQEEEAELEQEEQIACLADIKRWMYKGNFTVRFLSTCPQPVQIDPRNDRPFEEFQYIPNHGLLRQTKKHISEQSKLFLNRIDSYQIDEERQEILVTDDFGIKVMYDASLEDLAIFERELVQIGTHFIQKNELDFDFDRFEYPLIDRIEVLDELLKLEVEYQFLKAQVVLAYMDALEHSCDVLAQQRLMQIVVDVMAWRPRLDLQRAWYFRLSYLAEIQYLKTLLKILQTAVNFQMSNEKSENRKIKDYLNLCFKLADEYKQMSWTDVPPDQIKEEIKDRQYVQGGMRQEVEGASEEGGKPKSAVGSVRGELGEIRPDSSEKKEKDKEKEHGRRGTREGASKGPQASFVEQLGFKAPGLKDQMLSQTPNDPLVDDMIDQDATFIKSQEGYPSFFRNVQDKLSRVSFSSGTTQYSSQPFGILDFYDSLTILPHLHSCLMQGQAELKNDLRPAGPVQETLMHAVYLEKCFVQLVLTIEQLEGNGEQEYKAQKYLETNLVVANPDKILFLVKDMVATLNKQFKKSMNPLWVGKLDLHSINHFSFPDLKQDYFQSEEGRDINFNRRFNEGQLLKTQSLQAHFFPRLRDDDKQINAPPMLLVFCNLVEMLRLREHLILAITETKTLEDCFNQQRRQLGASSPVQFESSLELEYPLSVDKQQVNLIEHGSLLAKIPNPDSGLAIDEICPSIRSNLNFMSTECIQTLSLEGGLSNLQTTCHYQVVHKQLVQLSVQNAHVLLLPVLKAQIEIELFTDEGIQMPNGTIDYNEISTGIYKIVSHDKLNAFRSRVQAQRSQAAQLLENVLKYKGDARQTVRKLWERMHIKLSEASSKKTPITKEFQGKPALPINQYTHIKLLRDYKLGLANIAAREIHKGVITQAIRVQAMHLVHGRLKHDLNFFAGLRAADHPFQFEKGHDTTSEPRFIKSNLNSGLTNLVARLYDDEDAVAEELLTVLPSLKSLQTLPVFSALKQKWDATKESLFDRHQHLIDYSTEHLEMLVYKNISVVFDLDNKRQRFLRQLFPGPPSQPTSRKAVHFLTFAKAHSLPSKVLQVYKQVHLLFSFVLFQHSTNLKPLDLVQMHNAVDENRQFWNIEEATPQGGPSQTVPGEKPSNETIEQRGYQIEDSALSQRIIEQVSKDTRHQGMIVDEVIGAATSYKQMAAVIMDEYRKTDNKLDNLIQHLVDVIRMNQMKILRKELGALDQAICSKTIDESTAIRRYEVFTQNIARFGGHDLTLPFFLNGLAVNSSIFSTSNTPLRYNVRQDFERFKCSIRGLTFFEDLVPANVTLVSQVFDRAQQSLSFKATYPGQLLFQEGSLVEALRAPYLKFPDKESLSTQQAYHQQENQFYNMLYHDDLDALRVKDNLVSLRHMQILNTFISSLQLKFCVMMLLAGRSFPSSYDKETLLRDFVGKFQTFASWKINMYADSEGQRFQEAQETRDRKRREADRGTMVEAMRIRDNALQREARPANAFGVPITRHHMDEAFKFFLKHKCTKKVLIGEIEKIMMQASVVAVNGQISAISKALEMSSNKIDKYIPSKSGFASTLFDHVNRHQHLEISSKLPAIQAFLTKIRNRGLPTKTLTSGLGIIFTFKDFNECIHDFCQEMILFGEKTLKLRSESYLSRIQQLTEIIHYKDLKIDALKLKGAYVYDNIQKVVNSKVLQQGNTLVFALDKAMRELRFFQDHVAKFEVELGHAIHHEFRDQLIGKTQKIGQREKQIHDMQERLVNVVSDHIVNEERRIKDEIQRILKEVKLDKHSLQESEFGATEYRKKKMEEAQRLITQSSKNRFQNQYKQMKTIMSTNSAISVNPDLAVTAKPSDDLISAEDIMKIVMKQQEKMIQQRTLWDMRFVTTVKKYEDRIKYLEVKLSENQEIWQQMKQQDQRSKVLTQELNITQHSAQQNEKLIQKLKNEFKQKQKALQILESQQITKDSKLNELQFRVGKMELNKNIDVDKLIEVLMKQTLEIDELKKNESHIKSQMQMAEHEFAIKRKNLQKQVELEMELKNEAMAKVDEIKKQMNIQELITTKSGDTIASLYRDKFEELFNISKRLRQENQDLRLENEMLKRQLEVTGKLKDSKYATGTNRSQSQANHYQDMEHQSMTTQTSNSFTKVDKPSKKQNKQSQVQKGNAQEILRQQEHFRDNSDLTNLKVDNKRTSQSSLAYISMQSKETPLDHVGFPENIVINESIDKPILKSVETFKDKSKDLDAVTKPLHEPRLVFKRDPISTTLILNNNQGKFNQVSMSSQIRVKPYDQTNLMQQRKYNQSAQKHPEYRSNQSFNNPMIESSSYFMNQDLARIDNKKQSMVISGKQHLNSGRVQSKSANSLPKQTNKYGIRK